jgi:predicted phage terminase large subunit-like protein
MPYLGGKRVGDLGWRFPSGAMVSYNHCQNEDDVHSYQSKEFSRLLVDEFSQFTRAQFWYLLSRLRTLAPIRTRFYGATNPDPESYCAELIDWWVRSDGHLDANRCGKLRWLVRDADSDILLWFDTREAAIKATGHNPLSLTVVTGTLAQNKVLLAADPSYVDKLDALDAVNRERLKNNNWRIKAIAGLLFQRAWVQIIAEPPAGLKQFRCWDLAATRGGTGARTSGVRGGKQDGVFYVTDAVAARGSPGEVERMIRATAEMDGKDVAVRIWRDPGQSSVAQEERYTREVLEGFDCKFVVAAKDKITYFNPVSSCAESRNMKLVNGPWVADYVCELEGFPQAKVKDQVDATSLLWIAIQDSGFVILW